MVNEKRLIDANPIVQFIMDGLNNPDKMKALGHDAIEILAEIEFAPTVDAVEVVHGEWIYENGEWVCSVCKEPALYEVQVYGGGNYKDCDLVRSNYCPNCGAKMDGGNEDA